MPSTYATTGWPPTHQEDAQGNIHKTQQDREPASALHMHSWRIQHGYAHDIRQVSSTAPTAAPRRSKFASGHSLILYTGQLALCQNSHGRRHLCPLWGRKNALKGCRRHVIGVLVGHCMACEDPCIAAHDVHMQSHSAKTKQRTGGK